MSFYRKMKVPFIIILLFILISGTIYYSLQRADSQPQFGSKIEAENVMAAVLYSTSLIGEYDNDGKSVLAFIDHSGDIDAYETSGLESNSVIPYDNGVLLHEKNQITFIHPDFNVLKRDAGDCTVITGYGQSGGWIEKMDVSYSVFNQRFSDDSTFYISTLRWGNEHSFYCQDIKEYVLTDGATDSKLYLITTDIINHKDLYLLEIDLQENELVETKHLLSEKSTEDTLVFSKLMADQTNLYMLYSDMLEDKIELNMLHIDLIEKQIVDQYLLKEYQREADPEYFIYNKEAVQLIDDHIYFADGYGDVYSFQTLSKRVEYEFSLQDYERKEYDNDEMIYFNNDLLYFFRFDEQKGVHLLEEYQLDGERTKQVEISPRLQELIKRERVYIYDFKMLR